MKEYKISSKLFYISAVLFYLAAIINIFGGNNISMGVVWIGLGSAFLCLGSMYLKKSKEKMMTTRMTKNNKFQFIFGMSRQGNCIDSFRKCQRIMFLKHSQ